ncbi:MAG: DHA2 family efflux MFS transporter permease subunit [Clostridium sp.]|nr:DHA2 family efflux MFS transporter permease subunit [Clostridium sp.]
MNNNKKILGFIAIAIAAFLGVLDSTIVNIALPTITNYFNVSVNDASWISTIYVLAMSIFMITASKLADQFGRKKLMLIGISLFAVGSILCSISNSLIFLIAIRFMQGIGGAIVTPIVLPMGIEIFGKEKAKVVVASAGAIVACAAASGPPLGGILIEYINWRAVFFVNVPFCIVAFILTVLFIEESYDSTVSKKIDALGIIFLTISLFCLVFPLLKGRDYGWGSFIIISMFIISAVSLIIFLFIEHKSKEPMIELSLFKEMTFTTSSICYMILGFSTMCPLLIFNYFLQNVLNYGTLESALIIMSVSVTGVISIPLGTLLANKINAKFINFLGVFIFGIGILLLSRVTVYTVKLQMILDLVTCGLGLGFSVQLLSTSIKYLPKEKSGIGSGIINAFRQIGTCVGIAIMVSVLDTNVSNAKNNIKVEAVSQIENQKDIIYPVRQKLINIVNNSDENSSMSSKTIENELKTVLENNEKMLSTADGRPKKDSSLAKLYDGTGAISGGIKKVDDGQNKLGSGINNMNSGLDKLNSGSGTLIAGFSNLNNGITKVASGAQKLSDSGKNLTTFSNGLNTLNGGMQKFLIQFSSSSGQNPTLCDGIDGISNGASSITSGIDKYTMAVDTTLFTIIKNDPASSKMLLVYKNQLDQCKAEAGTSNNPKVQMLTNLVEVYTAANDPAVSSVDEFQKRLYASSNVVSSGNALKDGASKLSQVSSKVQGQFQDGGALKNAAQNLAQGTSKLASAGSNLVMFQDGVGKLSDSISKINDGSQKLYNGFVKVQGGISSAKTGSDKLKDGSEKLLSGTNILSSNSGKIVQGVGLLGQKEAILNVTNKIKDDKNTQISDAFKNTFVFAAIITMISSVLGLFTDKKIVKDK